MRQGCRLKVSKRYNSIFLSALFLVIIFLCSNVSSQTVFEISVSIVEDGPLSPGDTFHIIAELRNRESEGRVDVTVTYDILDSNNIALLSDSETVAVETKSSFAEEFTLPSSVSEGTYYFRATVTSLEGVKLSEASQSFSVFVVEEGEQRVIEYIMVAALIVTIGGLLFEHRRVSKMKVSGKDFKKFLDEKGRFGEY